MKIEKIHRNGYFPQEFKQIYSRLKNNCSSQQKQFKMVKDHQRMIEKAITEIKGALSTVASDQKQSKEHIINEIMPKFNETLSKIQKLGEI